MAIYRFAEHRPKVAPDAWVADSARVIGNVQIGSGCYIGHGAILRGDYGRIVIGPGTAVEESATLHIRPNGTSHIGERVTIGHGAIVHSNRIEDFAVIGMGAVLSLETEVGRWAIIGEGCVLPMGAKIPSEKIVTGVPGTIARDVAQSHKDFWSVGKQLYVDLAAQYPSALERID